MVANTRPDESLDERLGRVLAEAIPAGVISVYLFGSQADGRAHRDSDVDVAVLLNRVVFESAEARFDARVRLSGWLASEIARVLTLGAS